MKRLVTVLVILVLLFTCGCFDREEAERDVEEPVQPEVTQPDNNQQVPDTDEQEINEHKEDVSDKIVNSRLAVAGDIVAHMPLNNDAYDSETGEYDFSHIYQYAAEIFKEADYCVADIETTFSGDGTYSGYPCFDSPDELAYDLKEVGIDLLNTANNHSMDTGFNGLCRTLDVLDNAGIAHVGTYRTQEERDGNNGIITADINGVSVAFLSYTYGTNGIYVDEDKMFSVNIFNVDYMTNLSIPNYEKIDADMEYARALETDFIAVIMHWGNEYQTQQNSYQEEIADYLFQQGADIILGGHTHVPQPMEMREITLPDGTVKTGFICYCLGNFTSNQQDRYTNLTAIVNIDFEKNMSTGEATIKEVSYVPMFMLHRQTENEKHLLLDIYDAMSQYESGDTSLVDDELYSRLQTALADIHGIMGEELDCMNVEASNND